MSARSDSRRSGADGGGRRRFDVEHALDEFESARRRAEQQFDPRRARVAMAVMMLAFGTMTFGAWLMSLSGRELAVRLLGGALMAFTVLALAYCEFVYFTAVSAARRGVRRVAAKAADRRTVVGVAYMGVTMFAICVLASSHHVSPMVRWNVILLFVLASLVAAHFSPKTREEPIAQRLLTVVLMSALIAGFASTGSTQVLIFAICGWIGAGRLFLSLRCGEAR